LTVPFVVGMLPLPEGRGWLWHTGLQEVR